MPEQLWHPLSWRREAAGDNGLSEEEADQAANAARHQFPWMCLVLQVMSAVIREIAPQHGRDDTWAPPTTNG